MAGQDQTSLPEKRKGEMINLVYLNNTINPPCQTIEKSDNKFENKCIFYNLIQQINIALKINICFYFHSEHYFLINLLIN